MPKAARSSKIRKPRVPQANPKFVSRALTRGEGEITAFRIIEVFAVNGKHRVLGSRVIKLVANNGDHVGTFRHTKGGFSVKLEPKYRGRVKLVFDFFFGYVE